MTTTDALEQTLELVRIGWTQNALARNGGGKWVRVTDPGACSFSLDGALIRATWPDSEDTHESKDAHWYAANEAAYRLAELAGMNGEYNAWAVVQEWNDALGRTKDEVEHLLRCALAKEEK